MSQIIKQGEYYEIPGQEDILIKEHIIQSQPLRVETNEQKELIDYSSISADQALKKLKDNQNCIAFYKQNPSHLGITESPQEKLNRLKSELSEFKEQIQYLENQNKNVQQKQDDNKNALVLNEIEALERQLASISEMEGVRYLLNKDGLQEYSMPYNLSLLQKEAQKNVTQNLIKNIELMNQEAQQSNQQAKPQKEPAKIELYIDDQLAKLDENQKYIELEKRLEILENVLGKDKLGDKQIAAGGSLSGQQQQENLIQKVDYIQNNIKIFQKPKLEEIQMKIQNLSSHLDATLSKRSDTKLTSAELKKIDDMYERLSSVSGAIDELPNLVDRMESLKILHEESAGFLVNMNNLVKMHNQIIEQFDKNDTTIKTIQDSFANNLSVMKANFQNLEERIEKLEKQNQ